MMSKTERKMSAKEQDMPASVEVPDRDLLISDDPLIANPSHPLATEIQFFYAHRADLLHHANDKYIVIQGDRVEGPFDSEDEAIQQGSLIFGSAPMLVQHVTPKDQWLSIA